MEKTYRRITDRILSLLQLTRMALVFTAIADSLCGLLLRAWHMRTLHGGRILDYVDPPQVAAMAVISVGLYGYGMSLNDIIDRRRDRQIAAHRPLPSGRVGIVTAHVLCFLLLAAALAAGAFYSRRPIPGTSQWGWPSLALVVWTAMLITFYDLAGKYLVWPGLLCLGLIRCFHAVIACPELPLLWHPLLLLNHVAILSTLGYSWEEKRPALTRVHRWSVAAGLGFIDVCAIALVGYHRLHGAAWTGENWGAALAIQLGLLWPAAAAAAFVALALLIRLRSPTRREAGQKLVLAGLLWLIVYDAAFAAGYAGPKCGAAVLLLLPVAWLAVRILRWWAKILALSQRPQYLRAGVDEDA